MRRPFTIVLFALVLLAGCGEDAGTPKAAGGTSSSVPSSTTITVAGTTTTTMRAAVNYQRPGTPTSVTKGLVQGASPDGSSVYVEVVDPVLSKPGCEGQPDPVLFRVPLSGGAREPVMAGTQPVRGTIERGPGGRVVVTSGCEEFTAAIFVGNETPDGHLTNLKAVPLVPATNVLRSVSFSADGSQLVATRSPGSKGRPWPVVRVDTTNGAATTVFEVATGQIDAVAQLADGTFVVSADNQVTLRDATGKVKVTAPGSAFAVAPGPRVVAYGAGLGTVSTLAPDSPTPVTALRLDAGQAITSLDVARDGSAVAFTVVGRNTEALQVATLSDGRATPVAGPPQHLARPAFTGDGRALAFNVLSAAGDAEVNLVRFGT